MSKIKLEPEEQELLDAFESGKLVSVLTAERREEIEQAAVATSKRDKRINIRLSSRDLSAIQRRALEEGIPYQALVASILHKYASGSLYDATANKAN